MVIFYFYIVHFNIFFFLILYFLQNGTQTLLNFYYILKYNLISN